MTNFGQCLVLDLADAFFGHADDSPDLFERHGTRLGLLLPLFGQTETVLDHFVLDIRQFGSILADDVVDFVNAIILVSFAFLLHIVGFLQLGIEVGREQLSILAEFDTGAANALRMARQA